MCERDVWRLMECDLRCFSFQQQSVQELKTPPLPPTPPARNTGGEAKNTGGSERTRTGEEEAETFEIH